MGLQPVGEITTTYPTGEAFKHPLLDVNCDNPAIGAHEATHGNGEKTHARADVYGRVAWSHIGGQDVDGIVKEAPDRIIEGEATPPWADVFVAHKEHIEETLHKPHYSIIPSSVFLFPKSEGDIRTRGDQKGTFPDMATLTNAKARMTLRMARLSRIGKRLPWEPP
jgi:hypothetical protein